MVIKAISPCGTGHKQNNCQQNRQKTMAHCRMEKMQQEMNIHNVSPNSDVFSD
jgi:hypothetical protein